VECTLGSGTSCEDPAGRSGDLTQRSDEGDEFIAHVRYSEETEGFLGQQRFVHTNHHQE
jgi:hypothetical protein